MKKRFHQIELFLKYPHEVQKDSLTTLLKTAESTEWGKRYDFKSIDSYETFKSRIPLQDYNSLKEDIERTKRGEKNIMWPTEIKWFAQSSGTTSDKSKFIPVSEASLFDCHYKGGKDMLSIYCNWFENTRVFTGKTITMGGSSKINPHVSGSYTGDLSAILIDNLPFWVTRQRSPGKDIVFLDNWEEKIEKMADRVIEENITSISGVPSWTQVLFNRVLEKTKSSNLKEVWPNLELYLHGAVNFDPYRSTFQEYCPDLNYLETYNASEGFFGLQFDKGVSDFLLMLDYGIFYEFIPVEEWEKEDPKCLTLDGIELAKSYAIVISTNAGLWRYQLGDSIEFTSLSPFKIRITGRTKHFINAFGEELIIDNADKAIAIACEKTQAIISDYTAAPQYLKGKFNGCHEWAIEFNKTPSDINYFQVTLDNALKSINSDYEAKRFNDMILGPPKIHTLPKGTFYQWLKNKGKLGGQNKVPRLKNDRTIIEEILS
jgi:hypothetical protein